QPQRPAQLQDARQLPRIHPQRDVDVLGEPRYPVDQHRLAPDQHEGQPPVARRARQPGQQPGQIRRAGGHSRRARPPGPPPDPAPNRRPDPGAMPAPPPTAPRTAPARPDTTGPDTPRVDSEPRTPPTPRSIAPCSQYSDPP